MNAPLIVSASGVRGVVDRTMTAGVAARYGAAFGTFLREATANGAASGHVLVGRDTRASGPSLAAAASAGLRASGWEVQDLGVVPTPTMLLATRTDDRAAGCLIVTASHNPVEWNGLKLGAATGRFLQPDAARRVRELFERREEPETGAEVSTPPENAASTGPIDRHVREILDLPIVDPRAIASADLLVALDCVRGVGGLIVPSLLDALGCRYVGMDLEPDGRFPRAPEPVPENLGPLGDLVRDTEADLGMAIDPDGDRLAIVDERGRAIGEDWTLALAAEYVLGRRQGPVVTNLSSSQCIEDAADRGGVPLFRTPVGEIRVATRMMEVDAAVGGEGNGGVILPDLNLTRDAPLAATLVLGLLASRGRTVGELLGGWPSYRMVKRKADRPGDPLEALYRRLETDMGAGAAVDREDGLRLSWRTDQEWIHVRPSGTEPVLRIYAEAPDEDRAREIASRAEAILAQES